LDEQVFATGARIAALVLYQHGGATAETLRGVFMPFLIGAIGTSMRRKALQFPRRVEIHDF